MRWIVFILLLFTAGCNTIQIEEVRYGDQTVQVNDVMSKHFTPEALQAVCDIHMYEGMHIHPYVVGVNFWSSFISIITFNGVGRKVIASQGTLVDGELDATIVHEYMHQLDDMDRDGEIDLIDHLEFWEAFLAMRRDPSLKDVTDSILDKSDQAITNIFGIGPTSEIIAYTVAWAATHVNECPASMHHALSRILKASSQKSYQS